MIIMNNRWGEVSSCGIFHNQSEPIGHCASDRASQTVCHYAASSLSSLSWSWWSTEREDGDGDGTNALVIVGSNYRLTLCGSGAEAAEVVARRWAHNFRAWSKGSPISRSFWIGVGGVGAVGSGEVGQRLCRLWTKINKIARRRSKRWSSSALNCCCWFRIEGAMRRTRRRRRRRRQRGRVMTR